MKFIHLADLHLGKSIHGVSLIDNGDQPVWTERFLSLMEEIRPDAVVIAGDIYDRSAPSGSAVVLFDHFLTELAKMKIPVLMIAGNHDSGQRISYAGELLETSGIYISGMPDATLKSVEIKEKDGSGSVTFWLMPYLFPSLAAQVLGDDSIRDYDTAMRRMLENQQIDTGRRNILVAHQNVTAGGKEAERGGSESMVGGVGQMEYTVFDAFDYVALGHIHAAYPVGRPEVRYAGSPMPYHFDELKQAKKGPLLVEIGEKKDGKAMVRTRLLEIAPLHPMREIRGTYDEIRRAEEAGTEQNEYLKIVLTDCRVTPEIADYFRSLYQARNSIVMELVSEYRFQTAGGISDRTMKEVAEAGLEALFAEFYMNRRKEEPDEEQRRILNFAEQLVHEQKNIDDKGRVNPDDAVKLLEFVQNTFPNDGGGKS